MTFDMWKLSLSLAICDGNPPATGGFPSETVLDVELTIYRVTCDFNGCNAHLTSQDVDLFFIVTKMLNGLCLKTLPSQLEI